MWYNYWGQVIILMDKSMPVMDGLEATRILKKDESTKAIPIIAISSSAMKGDKERMLQEGADDYMSKPVDIYKVLKIVSQYVQRQ